MNWEKTEGDHPEEFMYEARLNTIELLVFRFSRLEQVVHWAVLDHEVDPDNRVSKGSEQNERSAKYVCQLMAQKYLRSKHKEVFEDYQKLLG